MNVRTSAKIGGIIIIVLMALYVGTAIYSFYFGQEPDENTVNVYFYNPVTGALVPEQRSLPEESYNKTAEYLWGLLVLGPKTQGLSKIYPDSLSNSSVEKLSILKPSENDTGYRNIEVCMRADYLDVAPDLELIFRSAVVWTFTELDWVNEVFFSVDGVGLTRLDGNPIGAMDRSNVLISPQITKEKVVRKTVELYFADSELSGLVAERRVIEVPSNVSEERIVLQELLKGPETDGLVSAIPSDTVINDVNTESMTCYVDLNSAFDNKLLPGTGARKLAVYSIVNTLTGLTKGDVSRVQFLINAERVTGKNLEVDLNQTFERDDGLIIVKEEHDGI